MLMILYPMVYNVILPLNESRKFIILCDIYYFVDPQEYSSIFLLYTLVLIFILYTIIGTQFTIIIFVQHCCGFFKIARLEKNILYDVISIKINNLVNSCHHYLVYLLY